MSKKLWFEGRQFTADHSRGDFSKCDYIKGNYSKGASQDFPVMRNVIPKMILVKATLQKVDISQMKALENV